MIDANNGAFAKYNIITQATYDVDYGTQNTAIGLLSGRGEHRLEFIGFVKEHERD